MKITLEKIRSDEWSGFAVSEHGQYDLSVFSERKYEGIVHISAETESGINRITAMLDLSSGEIYGETDAVKNWTDSDYEAIFDSVYSLFKK